MNSSQAVTNYTKKCITDKLSKLISKPTLVEMTFTIERHNHHAQLALKMGKFSVSASDVSTDMYISIDNVVDKVDQLLKKKLAKKQDRSKAVSAGNLQDTLGTPVEE